MLFFLNLEKTVSFNGHIIKNNWHEKFLFSMSPENSVLKIERVNHRWHHWLTSIHHNLYICCRLLTVECLGTLGPSSCFVTFCLVTVAPEETRGHQQACLKLLHDYLNGLSDPRHPTLAAPCLFPPCTSRHRKDIQKRPILLCWW